MEAPSGALSAPRGKVDDIDPRTQREYVYSISSKVRAFGGGAVEVSLRARA
jgi:hypothetical protein